MTKDKQKSEEKAKQREKKWRPVEQKHYFWQSWDAEVPGGSTDQ